MEGGREGSEMEGKSEGGREGVSKVVSVKTGVMNGLNGPENV